MMSRELRFLSLLAPAAVVSTAFSVDFVSVSEAQKILFPEASTFVDLRITLDDKQLDTIKELAGVRQRNKNPTISVAKKKDRVLGYFLVDDVVGKHEFITYATAIDTLGNIIGVEIVSYRETHGGQIRQESWRKNFVGKKISDPFKLDKDVPNITGATLSCRNVLDGVKRQLALFQVAKLEKSF